MLVHDGINLNASLHFASIGCNRVSGALSSDVASDLVVYAGGSQVAVLRNAGQRLETTLGGGGSRVNVTWCGGNFVAAGDCEGIVKAWMWENDEKWTMAGSFETGNGVVGLDGEVLEGKKLLLVVGDIGGNLAVWTCEGFGREWRKMAEMKRRNPATLVECVAMRRLGSDLLIAVGGTVSTVMFFAFHLDDESLKYSGSIPGHTGWVRSLSFSAYKNGLLYLASGSADGTARVWKIWRLSPDDEEALAVLSDIESLGPPKLDVEFSNAKFRITADAILDEHTKAVLSVRWDGSGAPNSRTYRPALLTSSIDNSAIIWKIREGRWTPLTRLGLLGGSASSKLGFYGSASASKGQKDILAHTFGGALHCWRANECETWNEERTYSAVPAPSGHSGAVSDIAWSSDGSVLLSCGEDKTTRLWASSSFEKNLCFAEWARPQVHGHAIRRLAFTQANAFKFASCSEEKVVRLFQAPAAGATPTEEQDKEGRDCSGQTAILPALGLSNKLVRPTESGRKRSPTDSGRKDASESASTTFSVLTGEKGDASPPLEEDLMQGRLWPEIIKLYGHGNDLQCLTTDLRAGIIASASRATRAKDAAIILWDAESLEEENRLLAHDLTINQICFAPSGCAILSVSRDRTFAIYSRSEATSRERSSKFSFKLLFRQKSAHKRLLYCGAWSPDGYFFATGSRDKCLKIFSFDPSSDKAPCSELSCCKFSAGVSALDFCEHESRFLLAIGLDDGGLAIGELTGDGRVFALLYRFSAHLSCDDRVTRILWRPVLDESAGLLQLAVSSCDHSVRIFSVTIT